MSTQIQQDYPRTTSVYYDASSAGAISLMMPVPPIDGQEVVVYNVSESTKTVLLHANAGTYIIDPVTLQSGTYCELSGARGSTRFQYRAEDTTWHCQGIQNDGGVIDIASVDPNGGKFKVGRGYRTIEVISKGQIELDASSQVLRQPVIIKNACPNAADVVVVYPRSILTPIRLFSGRTVSAVTLNQGFSVQLQAFSTYWLLLGYLGPYQPTILTPIAYQSFTAETQLTTDAVSINADQSFDSETSFSGDATLAP